MNYQATLQPIKVPQLKSTVIPIPLSGQRLALHRGPFKAEHQLMVLDDPDGLVKAAIDLMDGARGIGEITSSLRAEQFAVDTDKINDLVDMLVSKGVIADAAALSTEGMRPDLAARYSRNLNAWAALTPDERTAVHLQREVSEGHVLILGVGGIGTSVAMSLAMAGCGHLTLVDFDTVELQNLNRQLLFNLDDVGKVKVDVAKAALLKINPNLEIATLDTRLESAEHVYELIKSIGPDFVSAAADRPTVAIDRWINDACFALGIPFSSNSVSGNTALFWTKVPGETGCYNCDDLWAKERTPDHYEVKRYREAHDLIAATSAFSFTAMAIGAMTASEIVRSLVKWPMASAGRAILVDFSTLKTLEYDRPAHPECQTCGIKAGGNGSGPTPWSLAYHPLPRLLEMTAEEILTAYRNGQFADFTAAFDRLRTSGHGLVESVDVLRRYLSVYPNHDLVESLEISRLSELFRDVHDHVMSHPVWVHPLFIRLAKGDVTSEQLGQFARHYFNQVKNTRQCVALALGRFHTLLDRPDGELNNVLSELTQVVLAGLLADEYGVSTHPSETGSRDASETVNIGRLFSPVTHPELYRRFLDSLGFGVGEYDVPMLHGVADNVLVQRILSGDPSYDSVESLASVGLGMEWGVPAFFSMIIAGILKLSERTGSRLQPRDMEIWTAHVQQDVEHAVAAMIVTSFYIRGPDDLTRVKGATNLLMAFRYDMLSDIYREVFGDACGAVDTIGLERRYLVADRRIEPLIQAGRRLLRASAIRDYDAYQKQADIQDIRLTVTRNKGKRLMATPRIDRSIPLFPGPSIIRESRSCEDNGALELVPIEDIYLHEEYDTERVNQLADAITIDRLQRHPVILGHVDNQPLVHLDGASRIEALRRLNCQHVAAQIVDYGDEAAISLGTWSHLTRVDYLTLRRVTRSFPGSLLENTDGDDAIRGLARGRFLATVHFADGDVFGLVRDGPISGKIDLLRALSTSYAIPPVREIAPANTQPWMNQRMPGDHPSANAIITFMDFSKDDVLRVALGGENLFPPGITRHIVNRGRILYVNTPLSLLWSRLPLEEKQERFQAMLAMRRKRFYRETTIQYED